MEKLNQNLCLIAQNYIEDLYQFKTIIGIAYQLLQFTDIFIDKLSALKILNITDMGDFFVLCTLLKNKIEINDKLCKHIWLYL